MKYRIGPVVLFALLLAAPAVLGEGPGVVVVDPGDLRKPVPDPEQGLTEKYGDKVVRVSGDIRRASFDKQAKIHRYELHLDILQPVKPKPGVKVKGKPAMEVAETIVVPLTFQEAQKELQQEFEKLARSKGSKGVPLTVQGKGAVMSDGTLVVSEAVIIPQKAFSYR